MPTRPVIVKIELEIAQENLLAFLEEWTNHLRDELMALSKMVAVMNPPEEVSIG